MGTWAEIYEHKQQAKEEDKELEERLGCVLAKMTTAGLGTGGLWLGTRPNTYLRLLGFSGLFYYAADIAAMMKDQSAIGMVREALGKGKRREELIDEWKENLIEGHIDKIKEHYATFEKEFNELFSPQFSEYLKTAETITLEDFEGIRDCVLGLAYLYGVTLSEEAPDIPIDEVVPLETRMWLANCAVGPEWYQAGDRHRNVDLYVLDSTSKLTALKNQLREKYDSVLPAGQPGEQGEEEKDNGD